MNALRQFISASDSDSVLISLPAEYRQQRLEIIILPVAEPSKEDKLLKLMDEMADKAQKRGLTSEILEQLLNEE
jgi:hypothetical protein